MARNPVSSHLMKIVPSHIDGLLVITPRVFRDERGYFLVSFSEEPYREAGILSPFVQDNQSLSQKGVLRGLHFQKPPFAQGKLVRVIKGSVLDVAVDIRRGSPTYGQYQAEVLSEENQAQFWIPPGFAHGFLTLEDHTIFSYKCTEYYNRESEDGIRWNDPDVHINWGVQNPTLSDKDQAASFLKDLESPFSI